MTALLIGQLIDEGHLSLDTKLEQVLPRLSFARGAEKITIRMLLSHRSGLADVTALKNSRLWPSLFTSTEDLRKSRDRLAQAILETKLIDKPDTKTAYSNSGFVVLGSIVEELEDRLWEESLEDRVWKPLGMVSCGFGPAGTVHCKTDDLAKFYLEVLHSALGKPKLLTPETAASLLAMSKEKPYTLMSMGRSDKEWARGELLGINGSNTLNFTSVAIAPRLGRLYLLNTNSATPKAEAGVAQVMRLLKDFE